MVHRHNVYDLLGVSGPGDGFTSSGPGGMSSAEAQAKAAQPSHAAEADEPGFFDTLFGDDEEPMVAEQGAADAAADAVVTNVFDDKGQIQHGAFVPTGGGGGGFSPAPKPGDPVPTASSSIAGPKAGSTTILALVAAGIGALFVFGK